MAAQQAGSNPEIFATDSAPNIANTWTALQTFNAGIAFATGQTFVSGSNTLVGAVADKLNAAMLAIASQAIGDVLYADTATTFARLADVAAGSYLVSGGVGAAPAWSAATLPNAAVQGDLMMATGANAFGRLAAVATGALLTSAGVGANPAWSTQPTIITADAGATALLLFTLAHQSSAPLAGIGAALKFQDSNSTPALVDAAQLVGVLTTVTAGVEVGALDVYTRTGGAALASTVRHWGSGGTSFGTTFVGTDTGNNSTLTTSYFVNDTNRYVSASSNGLHIYNILTNAGTQIDFIVKGTTGQSQARFQFWANNAGTNTAGRNFQLLTGSGGGNEIFYSDFDGKFGSTVFDAGATVVLGYTLGHQSSASANGIGVAIKSQLSDSANSNLIDATQISSSFTSNTAGSVTSALDFLTRQAGAALTSVLQLNGQDASFLAGLKLHVTTPVAGAYAAVLTDVLIKLPTQAAGITVTLPVSGAGKFYIVEANSDGATHNITIAITGGTVNGSASIATAYGRRIVTCDGTNAISQ